jgi:transposase-like protein
VTEELQQQIVEWQNRPLERVYPILFVDGLRVAVRTDKGVLKKCVYTVLGVGLSGKQEVLGLWIEETEGAASGLRHSMISKPAAYRTFSCSAAMV